MRENRMEHFFRIAARAQLVDRPERMLVWVLLPVEIVEQSGEAPGVLVFTEAPCVRAHRRCHGLHVIAQARIVDPRLEQLHGFVTRRHHAPPSMATG